MLLLLGLLIQWELFCAGDFGCVIAGLSPLDWGPRCLEKAMMESKS